MKKILATILLFCLLAIPCAVNVEANDNTNGGQSLFRGLDADEMFIGGFIGPRPSYTRNGEVIWEGFEDDAVFALIAETGINYISDNELSYGGKTYEYAKKALEYAEKYGLMYFMPAFDVMKIDGNVMASDEEIKNKLQEMYQYDSFGGIYLRDEPTSDMFPFIAQCLEKLNQLQGELGYDGLNVYLNMFPPTNAKQLSNNTDRNMDWMKYVRAFSDTGTNYLSFDMYPITDMFPKVTPSWFTTLSKMNQVALEDGKPWMGYVQVGGETTSYGSHSTQRVTTKGEFMWDINTMLAFGAKGINYYLLVSPPYFADTVDEHIDNHSIINVYGEKTVFWDYAKEANDNIKAMDHVLMHTDYKGVIFAGDSPTLHYGKDKIDTFRQVQEVTGNALVGCFDYNGKTALLVVNNSIEQEGDITLHFDDSYEYEVIQNTVSSTKRANSLNLKLGIGECALVVIDGPGLTELVIWAAVIVAVVAVAAVTVVVITKKRKK